MSKGRVADPRFFDHLYSYAWFVTFGLSGSRHLLLVDSKVNRVHLWGYAGPVIAQMTAGSASADYDLGGLLGGRLVLTRPATVAVVGASITGETMSSTLGPAPDGTGEIADRLAAELPHVDVLHRPAREGLGPAYVAGFGRALSAGADLVLEMDPAQNGRVMYSLQNQNFDSPVSTRPLSGTGSAITTSNADTRSEATKSNRPSAAAMDPGRS